MGDRVRVSATGVPEGAQIGGVPADQYAFSDFERRSALVWLAIAFAAIVIVTSRWRGLRALVGLAGSLLIIVAFVVPAILEGSEPVAVAVVGSLAVMLVTIPLAHGRHHHHRRLPRNGVGADPHRRAGRPGDRSRPHHRPRVRGGDLPQRHGGGAVDPGPVARRHRDRRPRGAGRPDRDPGVGGDGVRRSDPAAGSRRLFREALSVGHDHIAATVNTLVRAYVGASLPVLLVFSVVGTSTSDVVNSEVVAGEIVATLVGSIGLIAAVPVTTAIAAVLATRVEPARLADAHGHAH